MKAALKCKGFRHPNCPPRFACRRCRCRSGTGWPGGWKFLWCSLTDQPDCLRRLLTSSTTSCNASLIELFSFRCQFLPSNYSIWLLSGESGPPLEKREVSYVDYILKCVIESVEYQRLRIWCWERCPIHSKYLWTVAQFVSSFCTTKDPQIPLPKLPTSVAKSELPTVKSVLYRVRSTEWQRVKGA